MKNQRYVAFQSELLLQEVTAQQQGIELYQMMLKNMFIFEQQEGIDAQIESLYELNTSTNEKGENVLLTALALLGVVDLVNTVCEMFEFGKCIKICSSLSAVIIAITVWLIVTLRRKKISKK